MNRRGFLQFVSVATGSVLIGIGLRDPVARIKLPWANGLPRDIYMSSEPLAAGTYTFTAGAGDLGVYISGVKALGGETLFEVLRTHGLPMDDPRLIMGAIKLPERPSYDFTDPASYQQALRGQQVTRSP